MKDTAIANLDACFARAEKAMNQFSSRLQSILQDKGHLKISPEDTIMAVGSIQLLLQCRLDAQSVVARLLQFEKNLLQLLGIGPQYSERINLERLAYALGNDDLHQILYSLNQLLHYLVRIAYRYQQSLQKNTGKGTKKRAANLKEDKSPEKTHEASGMAWISVSQTIQQAIDYQHQFVNELSDAERFLMSIDLSQWETPGPIIDHIAALKIPISHFYQAVLHGMQMVNEIYLQVNHGIELDVSLAKLMQEAELTLRHLPPLYEPSLHFMPESQKLEERAQEKRLRYFW